MLRRGRATAEVSPLFARPRTGERGKGLASAGLILGIIFTLISVAVIALAVVVAKNATPTVAQSKVESQITDQLEKKVGQRPESVCCPGGLKGEVGTAMTCTLTAPGEERPVQVTVTSVDGLTVNFDIAVK